DDKRKTLVAPLRLIATVRAMRTSSLWLFGLISFSLATAACSGGNGPNGAVAALDGGAPDAHGNGGASLDIDAYYARLAVLGCQKTFDCCGGGGDEPTIAANWQGSAKSRQDCAQASVPN